MAGNPIFIGDFAEMEEKLAKGLISHDEYQKFFEKTRLHGFRGDIYPFAVGGSDAATILGVSPWKTPLRLYKEKFGVIKERKSKETEMIFQIGHIFESAFRDMFSLISGLKAEPFTKQAVNPAYPHIVANIDGLVWENGKPGVYEGKTTRFFTPTREHITKNEVPIYYNYQVQLYMEVLNLDFAYLNCGWGINANEMKYLRIERDRSLGREICMACERFVQNAAMGIPPTNSVVENLSVLAKDAEVLYGKVDETLPPVKIPSVYVNSFRRLDALEEEEKALIAKMQPFNDEIKKIEKSMAEEDQRLKSIKKEQLEILRVFPDVIKNGTCGELTCGNETWTVHYDSNNGKFSLDAEVKEYWKENFPECYEKVSKYKPNYSRQLSYEKRVSS